MLCFSIPVTTSVSYDFLHHNFPIFFFLSSSLPLQPLDGFQTPGDATSITVTISNKGLGNLYIAVATYNSSSKVEVSSDFLRLICIAVDDCVSVILSLARHLRLDSLCPVNVRVFLHRSMLTCFITFYKNVAFLCIIFFYFLLF